MAIIRNTLIAAFRLAGRNNLKKPRRHFSPWARAGSRFTTAFEDTAAWLVCHATLSVVAVLLRIAWRSVSGIVTRVVAARAGEIDRLAGLRRIGIEEISS